MHKKGRVKYFLVIIICFFIFIYGFFIINITKPELVRNKSEFKIDFTLEPLNFTIENEDYIFFVNNEIFDNKIFDNMKKKCIRTFNGIFSK